MRTTHLRHTVHADGRRLVDLCELLDVDLLEDCVREGPMESVSAHHSNKQWRIEKSGSVCSPSASLLGSKFVTAGRAHTCSCSVRMGTAQSNHSSLEQRLELSHSPPAASASPLSRCSVSAKEGAAGSSLPPCSRRFLARCCCCACACACAPAPAPAAVGSMPISTFILRFRSDVVRRGQHSLCQSLSSSRRASCSRVSCNQRHPCPCSRCCFCR